MNLVEKIARYYKAGFYKMEHLERMVQAEVLTWEQFQKITGQAYHEPDQNIKL